MSNYIENYVKMTSEPPCLASQSEFTFYSSLFIGYFLFKFGISLKAVKNERFKTKKIAVMKSKFLLNDLGSVRG